MSLTATLALFAVVFQRCLLSPFALLAKEAAGTVAIAAIIATRMMDGVIEIRNFNVVLSGTKSDFSLVYSPSD